jgi:hypothetical protein
MTVAGFNSRMSATGSGDTAQAPMNVVKKAENSKRLVFIYRFLLNNSICIMRPGKPPMLDLDQDKAGS